MILTLLAPACAASGFDIEDLPAEPPWGLDTIVLPDTADSIGHVLDAMPTEIDGVQVTVKDGQTVSYEGADGRSLTINVLPLSDLREFSGVPDMTPTDFLSALVESGELESVEFQDLENEVLALIAGTGRGNGVLQYLASWADPNGEWFFNLTADTPEARRELAYAFINAVEGSTE